MPDDQRGRFATIADADGAKPHRYLLGYDTKTGELQWDEESVPGEDDVGNIPVHYTWQRFDGGMGKTVEDGEGGYYFGENWYVTPYGLRPRPTVANVTLTGNTIPPEWMFEAASASGAKYLYSLAGTKVFKIRQSDKTLVNTRNLGAPTVSFATGSYIGTGIGRYPTESLTFRPKAVIVKANAAQGAVFKLDTMATFAFKDVMGTYTTGSVVNGIAITDNGFYVAGSSLNTLGTAYQWWAVSGEAGYVVAGVFSGTGVAQDIAVATMNQPDAIFIFTNNSADAVCLRIKTATADLTKNLSVSTPPGAGVIVDTASWPAGGFRVGTSDLGNRSGTNNVFYLALKTSTDVLEIGSYTGDGGHQSVEAPAFPPTFAAVYKAGAEVGYSMFQTDKFPTDSCAPFYAGAYQANNIESLDSLGFNVGSNVNVNSNTYTYYYLVIRSDPIGSIVFGRPDEWNSIWHLPCGQSVYFKRLTAITDDTSDDTWTATTLYGDHFRAAGNMMCRSNGRVVTKCSEADTTVAGNWGGAYSVGRVGEIVTDLVAVGDELGICTNLNFYLFDLISTARPMLGKNKPASADNGKGALQFYDWTLLPYGGLQRYEAGGAIPVGPDSIKGYVPVNGLTSEPVKLTHYGLDSCENIVYAAAKDAQSTPYYHLFWALRDPEAYRLRLDTLIYSATAMKVVFVDSTPTLWFSYGNDVAYILLSKDGKPEGGTFGEATLSADLNLYLGETDFGTTAMKRLLALEVGMRNDAANFQFAVGVQRDAGTPALVGAALSDDGLLERFFSTGVADTARRVRPYLSWTAAGYTPSATPPEVFSVTLRAEARPEPGDIITMGTTLMDDSDGTAKGKWARLKAMAAASTAKKIWDPDGDIIYATVIKVRRTELAVGKGDPPQRAALVFLRRSKVS